MQSQRDENGIKPLSDRNLRVALLFDSIYDTMGSEAAEKLQSRQKREKGMRWYMQSDYQLNRQRHPLRWNINEVRPVSLSKDLEIILKMASLSPHSEGLCCDRSLSLVKCHQPVKAMNFT